MQKIYQEKLKEGHTDPKITFPIGGEIKIVASSDNPRITIARH